MVIQGQSIETQRIRIETEQLNPDETSPFVKISHRHGSGTVTETWFTPAEARFILESLQRILEVK